jgi:prepilin-type N-terminal cleavage/methylation domain-containing protein
MRHRQNRGLSLLELMIVVGILVLLLGAIYLVIFRSSRTYIDASKIGTLAENGRRVLDQMANEIRLGNGATAGGTVVVGTVNGANSILLYPLLSASVTDGTPTYDTTSTTFRLDPGSVDANGNGSYSDDWKLVRVRTTPANVATTTTLCDYVKPAGLVITRSGNNMSITLTLHVRDDKNKLLEKALTTSTTLRNR